MHHLARYLQFIAAQTLFAKGVIIKYYELTQQLKHVHRDACMKSATQNSRMV